MKPQLAQIRRYAAAACWSMLAALAVQAQDVAEQVSGLWYYTGLTTSSGTEMPLTGIFLFKDGVFMQQSIFNGEPFGEQSAMAHAGPFEVRGDKVQLFASQTISTAPGTERAYSFRPHTEHELTIDRDGSALTIVFGSGTVQTFDRVGDGQGDWYPLQDGAFALVDDHFILIQGNADGAVTAYGTYRQDGEDFMLSVTRWAEAAGTVASNRRDVVVKARFDGRMLMLDDGRQFAVTR
jgi:hypothetical protein